MVNMLDQTVWKMQGWQGLRRTISAIALYVIAPPVMAGTSVQKDFEFPESGVDALVEAVKMNDQNMLRLILGPRSRKLVRSGDEVADAQRRERFLSLYSEANKTVLESGTKATLVIVRDEWPLPIPLVKAGSRWRFDTSQGEEEILTRRIGANELAAIQVCLAVVDAEREYAAQDRAEDGVPRYAARFASTPGNRDGLLLGDTTR